MEVIVVFEGGDTDKPMVLGSLYNGTHPPPFQLPSDRTRSGWRTQSSPGGAGFNELSFEDAATKEQIYVHAQRDLDEVVERNHTLQVRGNESVRVAGGRADIVEGDVIARVGGSSEEQVAGDQTTQVEGNRIDIVTGSSDERVSGTLVTRVEGRERRCVEENADLEYAEDLTVRVEGCMTTLVGKADKKRSWATHAEGTATEQRIRVVESVLAEGDEVTIIGRLTAPQAQASSLYRGGSEPEPRELIGVELMMSLPLDDLRRLAADRAERTNFLTFGALAGIGMIVAGVLMRLV